MNKDSLKVESTIWFINTLHKHMTGLVWDLYTMLTSQYYAILVQNKVQRIPKIVENHTMQNIRLNAVFLHSTQ